MTETIERAAGGFVVRIRGGQREVLLIDDAYHHVAFPKGHVEPGESWEDAALREVQEETGIEARILAPLGRLEYPIERDGVRIRKQVRLFLMEEIDEQDDPRYQAEEIRSAAFVPWDEAERAQQARGYANWSFVFAKADALWQWHEGQYEQKLRGFALEEGFDADFAALWQEASPVVDTLLTTVRAELGSVAPEWTIPEAEAATELPRVLPDTRLAMRKAVEHTLLKPEAEVPAIEALAREALRHEFGAVCVNPQHIGRVADILAGSGVIPCVVVGFPLGATALSALVAETEAVIAAGAREVDMVIPIGSMKEDDIQAVYERVAAVCDEAHRVEGVQVKVILETHFLTYAQVAVASMVSLAAGADFIKTSTGFAPSGARLADVALMSLIAGPHKGVKAAGGIRSREAAELFLQFGATRLGTSSGVALVR